MAGEQGCWGSTEKRWRETTVFTVTRNPTGCKQSPRYDSCSVPWQGFAFCMHV